MIGLIFRRIMAAPGTISLQGPQVKDWVFLQSTQAALSFAEGKMSKPDIFHTVYALPFQIYQMSEDQIILYRNWRYYTFSPKDKKLDREEDLRLILYPDTVLKRVAEKIAKRVNSAAIEEGIRTAMKVL